MKEAYHKRDLAMAHRLVLELACSLIGPRKRIRNAVRAQFLIQRSWDVSC